MNEPTGTESAGPDGVTARGSADEAAKASAAAEGESPGKRKYVPLWNNFVTMTGLFVTGMAVILLLTFALLTAVTPNPNPYVDIVGYLVVPGILVLGVAMIPFGILFKSWRMHRRDPSQRLAFRFPHVDLNDPAQRRAAKIVVISTFVLIPFVAVSGYHGYHYTDSAGFCSKACHTAMHPQATTYEHSAHARVACAECHIGTGASWFVRSKLSGTRQVLAMWRDSFSRPIPPAIHHLRPARETCEHCHWPKKFFGAQLREIVYYTSDEQNTRHEIDMLLKTGGGDPSAGKTEGIHLHMALEGRIEYIATDDKLQEIPWVRYRDAIGAELIYRSDGKPSSDPPPEGQLRTLDCMDCHNRPAHKFRSPIDAVDVFLDTERIDASLPFIKREAVKVLSEPYADTDTARKRIGTQLAAFYREYYPEIRKNRKVAVNKSIDGVREIYGQTFFPDMKVDWRTYPDNIGHKTSPGCFRCHEGKHVNQHGEPISHACDICHTFLNPVDPGTGRAVVERGDFVHPVELVGMHQKVRCDRCHSGGTPPETTCTGCHTAQAGFRNGVLQGFEELTFPVEPMADAVDCESCHDLDEPTTVEAIDAMCMDCHDDEEEYEGMLASWSQEAANALAEAEANADAAGREMLSALRRAGPLHNIAATRLITKTATSGSDLHRGTMLPATEEP